MNATILEALSHITAASFVLWIIAIGGIIGSIIAITIKGYKLIEKYRNARNEAEKKEDMIKEHETDIENLKKSVSAIDEKLDKLITVFEESETASKKYRMTSLHDRIFQLHRVVMQHGYISDDDLENFNKMVDEYLANNGNGIVKKKIIPEVMALPIKYVNTYDDMERRYNNQNYYTED